MSNENEIVEWRGIKNVVVAEVTADDGDSYECGTPFKLAGVAELSRATENSSETKYYDDIPALVVDSTGADTVTCSMSAIPLEVLAKITGQNYDEELGVLIEGEREAKYFALGYETSKTNGDVVYVWRHKGKFSIPDSSHKTKTNGTESNGQEVVYTGINTTHVFAKIGKTAKAINVDVSKGLVDTTGFFDTVQTIDTLKAPTV